MKTKMNRIEIRKLVDEEYATKQYNYLYQAMRVVGERIEMKQNTVAAFYYDKEKLPKLRRNCNRLLLNLEKEVRADEMKRILESSAPLLDCDNIKEWVQAREKTHVVVPLSIFEINKETEETVGGNL